MAPKKKFRPATTPEGRESQLISLAVDLAEKQIREGTATSQVITHYLKLGSTREALEQERLKNENLLLAARTEQIANAKKIEELYLGALTAMRNYGGMGDETTEHVDYSESISDDDPID